MYNMGYRGMRGGGGGGGGMRMQQYQHQQPQPQRANRRNNRGGGGNFRGGRFDPIRQPNQPNRPNKEVKLDNAPAPAQAQPQPVAPPKVEAPAAAKPQAQVAATPPKPQINQNQMIKSSPVGVPVNQTPNKVNVQINKPQQQVVINKPQQQGIQPKPQQQQQGIQNKPQQQQQGIQNKPQQQPQQGNQNKPQPLGILKGQQQGNMNKPQQQQQGNMNKPQQQQGNMNKPQQQQGNMNKPQQQQQGNMNKPQQQQGNIGNKPHQQQGNANKPQQQNNANKPQPLNNFNKPQLGPRQNSGNFANKANNLKGNNQLGGSRRNLALDKMGPGGREEHFMMSKLKEISGSTADLPSLEQEEQKFSGRNRLYIGNLSNEISEEDLLELFGAYGETSELFLNKEKNFAFIRMDYKANAEKAKHELDTQMRRGRPLRVRFAPHNAAIKVKNLTSHVSNELLLKAFEVFGKIERAIVKVDERGKSLGEGIVEFVRKAGAMSAIRNCSEKCFFLTASLRPVVVESFDEVGDVDGYTEKSLPRKNQEYVRARGVGPRFAEPGSFEHEYGTRWKQLYEQHKQKEEALRYELQMEEEKLEHQMEFAKYEHETELLREQLRQREQDRERQKRTWEMVERQADEQREKDREMLLRQQEDMAQRMRDQEDELSRRQQENNLFMQAHQLNRILDKQEQGMGGGRYDNSMMDKLNDFDDPLSRMGGSMDAPYMDHYDSMCGNMGYNDGMGQWDSRQEDYPSKRRRY